MLVTQKSQYAVKAIFALAMHEGKCPLKIASIAESQGIPLRFLEVILAQLKQGGFVDSKRGMEGGYWLIREPRTIGVGEVIRFIDGPLHQDGSQSTGNGMQDFFEGVWRELAQDVEAALCSRTIQELIDDYQLKAGMFSPDYTI